MTVWRVTALLLLLAASATAAGCASDLDCSLNGVCTGATPAGACECDAPWKGSSCGVLAYKTTPRSGFNLYTESDPHNTWNGAILRGSDGMYHCYNPLFPPGELGGTTTLMHGTATNVTGPFKVPTTAVPAAVSVCSSAAGAAATMTSFPLSVATCASTTAAAATVSMCSFAASAAGSCRSTCCCFCKWDPKMDITIPLLGAFDGPKSVVFTEDGKTRYSLWLGGNVYLADSAAGPFTMLEGFKYPGHNPAPLFHNGSFYTITSMSGSIMTTPRLVSGAVWTQWTSLEAARSLVPKDWLPEDPDMWVDSRGNWHIVNHCYNNHEFENCGTSVLSSHFFSPDGKVWHFLEQGVQPYSHTVQYDDGTSHNFVTMERPNMFFDEHGQLTHIHLAADLVTGPEGCGNRTGPHGGPAHFGHTPCDNCKYEDHGVSLITNSPAMLLYCSSRIIC